MSRRRVYRFDEMNVGDSLFIPARTRAQIGGSISYWQDKLNWVFTTSPAMKRGVSGILVRRVG